MRYNHSTFGNFRHNLLQPSGDVLIRQTMEAVATHTFRIEPRWNCIVGCDHAVTTMERRVEASDLRKLREALTNGMDRCQIIGLMQGRQWNEALKLSEHPIIDQDRLIVLGATVHDPMTD